MRASQSVLFILLSAMTMVGLLGLPTGTSLVWATPQGVGEATNGADKGGWREMATLKQEHAIQSLACSADLCAAADEGGNVFVWATKSGKDRNVIMKGTKDSLGDRLQFTGDGEDLYLVYGARLGIMRFPVKNKKIEGGYGIGGGDDLGYFGVSGDGETWLEFLDGGKTLNLRANIYRRKNANIKPFETVDFKVKATQATVSPGNKWLAVATDDGTLHIHSRDSLQEMHAIVSGKDRVAITEIQFSPDGQRVVVSRDDAMAKVYDCTKGEEVATLKGHTGIVFAAAFSPDGKMVVTGGDDNTARIWDTSSGKELAALKAHTDSVRCVAFDPTGEFLVTGSADKTVKIWKAK